MKIVSQKGILRGIAMTEYLIILAVVAVAAILIVGLFGKSIKAVFAENTAALAGTTSGSAAATAAASSAVAAASTGQDNMSTFNTHASSTSD